MAVLARFTGKFFCQFMSLCKSLCFIRGRGEPSRVFVSSELLRVSVARHACACVLVCVFLWVKSQDSTTTEPE